MHQYIALEDTVYFGFGANLTTGAAGDGATPLFDVRLAGAAAGAAPVLSGTPTLLTHANYTDGCYEVAVAATAGNGFAAGSTYLVFVSLTISSVTPAACVGSFKIAPVVANATQLLGTAWATPATAGLPDVNAIQLSGDATAANNAEAFFDGTGYAGTNNIIPTVTAVTGLTASNLDATISSRMATYAQPTGFLAATFPAGTVANTTNITGGTITTVTTLTGHTAQTGDTYALANGASGFVAIKGNTADILVDTAVIGALGAGLTAIPWNAAWDAEVESEVNNALVVQRLDELLNADSDIDGAAPPTVGSVFHELMTKTAGSFTYDQTTDALEALRDRGDAAWITATGFSTQASVDTIDGIVDAILLDTAEIGAAGAGLTALGDARIANLDAAMTTRFSAAAMTESYAALGATRTPMQILYEIRALLAENTVAAVTVTTKKLDGATTAHTYTINDAATPTSITAAS